MAQLYMLSILSLLGAGLILSSDYLVERMEWLTGLKELSQQREVRMGVGIAAGVVGVLKLMVQSPGETVVFAGDLLPALTGIALGGLLIADTLRVSRDDEPTAVDNVSLAIMPYRTPLGLGGIGVAAVHFLLPSLTIL